MSRDLEIEQMIQERNLNASRITLEKLHEKVKDVEIVKHVSSSGQVLRWAVLTVENGSAVTGKSSCAVSSENDNAEVGERIAIENASDELWPLEDYLLKDTLFNTVD